MSERPLPRPIGWPLLPVPDEHGRLEWPTLEQSVADHIRVVLATRPGEQLMRPRFGAGLDRFVHAQNTLTVRRRIHDLVAESLGRWAPRVDVERVEVAEVAGEPTRVRVEVVYRIKRTGATRRQGLTLDLEG